jgi:hypothetical protein
VSLSVDRSQKAKVILDNAITNALHPSAVTVVPKGATPSPMNESVPIAAIQIPHLGAAAPTFLKELARPLVMSLRADSM